MLESKDAIMGSKILVDFLRDFTQLTESQLVTIRAMMESTVAQVMDSITVMSNVATAKNTEANEVLVKDQNSQDFVASSSKNLEQSEQTLLEGADDSSQRRSLLEAKLLRTGGIFTKHMEAISGLNGEVQNFIAKVVGAVSMDDVIAQRLSHIIISIQVLHRELSKLLINYREESRSTNIKQFRNRVLTQVYLSYTSEEEKEIFHRIFGHPKEVKAAV